MTINTNAGLKISMQSAIGAGKTITDATNADPGVFTSTAHGFTNGNVILLEVQGMVEVDKRLYKVNNVAANTFELGDIDGTTSVDTSGFSVFSSGTAKLITFGTSITGLAGFTAAGGDIKTVNSTTVNDVSDKELVIGSNPMSYDLQMQWDPANTAQQAMRTAFDLRAEKAFKIQWPTGTYILFYGTVGYTMAPGGGLQEITTSPAKIALSGPLTNYAA